MFEFAVQEYPTDSQTKYFIAYLAGELTIKIDGQVFFSEPNMLLAEFSLALKKWLGTIEVKKKAVTLEYFTMDHDEAEGAILKLEPVDDTNYLICSIWQKFTCHRLIDEQELLYAATTFLKELKEELSKRGVGV